jgi:hypothetical protein
MLEAHGMLSSTTAMVTKAPMGVFTGLEMALIESMTVGSIMVEMLPGQLSFKDNGFDVINQIDQDMANPPQQEPSPLALRPILVAA